MLRFNCVQYCNKIKYKAFGHVFIWLMYVNLPLQKQWLCNQNSGTLSAHQLHVADIHVSYVETYFIIHFIRERDWKSVFCQKYT